MTNKRKYSTITIIIVLLIFSTSIYADGSGDDIHDGSEWKLGEDFIGSIANFWCRWVPIHYGNGVTAKIREGEGEGSDIIYIDRTEGKSTDVKATGYGLYQMDLRRHMVGYLYYLKSKASKDELSSIAKQQMEYEEDGKTGEPENMKLKEALKYVADKLITTAYSKDTVTKYLDPILTDIENMLGASEIKKHQSDFWYKVYGQKAYSLLTGSLGFSPPILDFDGKKKKIQGAVLSIMEDRYRNKTLKNKTTLQLSVEKGDLWPFLVYTETDDKGATTKWRYKEKEDDTKYKTTDWEKMLEGAYQYMIYYEYKVDEEADSEDYLTLYNGAKAEIFYSEYEELFGHPIRELKGEELDNFYRRIRQIRRYYKKSQENGGIFGEEEYDQSSDVAYSQAISAIENKMNTEPFKSVFKALDTENIARTYMMAKNIASNTRMIEQNAQYDIGSNIISRTPGGYDNNVLLSDLQLIKLERDKNGEYPNDADKDGIKDGTELDRYIDTDITGFVRQMMVAEGGESNADDLLKQYMINIKIANDDPEKANKQDAQRDLRVVGDKIYVNLMSYTSNPIFKDSDFDGVWDGYGYDESGNPIKENIQNDLHPLDSKISGSITTVENKTQDFETHMDYRYFFLDQYNYYDELSTMSLLLSNAVYDRNQENLSNLNAVNERIGLNLDYRTVEEDKVKPYNYKYKTKYAIGYKPVEYSRDNSTEDNTYIKKLIIPVIVPGMTEISDGGSYSEIGQTNWADKDKIDIVDPESHNVKSYEVYASMILSSIDEYERNVIAHDNSIKSDYKKVYWVTGYKEGGAIANILASKLIDNGNIVYAYTFGSPMTLYNNADEDTYSRNGYRARYDSIFNVVNTEDAYCFVMPQNIGFSRYGQTCFGSGKKSTGIHWRRNNNYTAREEQVSVIIDSIDKLYENNESKTREKTYAKVTTKNKEDNYLGYYNVFKRLICAIDKERNDKENQEDNLINFYRRYANVPDLSQFITTLQTNLKHSIIAGTDDIYYYISKDIRNEDIQNTVNYYDNQKKRDRKATASQLEKKYPNYQALIGKDINNPVPSIFQDAEVWSAFRYGASYSKDEATPSVIRNSREIKTYNDSNYDYGTFWESACGVTAPAIVLSYIFNKEITPMDVRDKLEEAGYPYRKKETGYSTAHPTENKIAELYGLNCEQLTYDPKDVDGNNSKTTNVVKSLLKGNPVIAIAHNGVFTVGGHYIVIAGVLRDNIDSLKDKCGLTAADINTLKTRDKPLTDTLIISKIDALKYDDLKDLSIYVLDPRYRHEYKRTKAEKKDGSNAKTMSTAWDIDTFKNGGAGNVNKFWIYTKGNNTENINQSELFNYNKTKYPSNYEEYFKPQTPKDSDEFCKVTKEDKRELGYFRKMQQDWKLHDFPNLVNYGG